MTPEKLAELERLARAAQNPLINFEVSFQCKVEERDYLSYFNPKTCLELFEHIRHLEWYKEDADRSVGLMARTIEEQNKKQMALERELKTAREDALREAIGTCEEACCERCAVNEIQMLIDQPSANEGNGT